MDIKIKERIYHPYGDKSKPKRCEKEVFIEDKGLMFGEGIATLKTGKCPYHGETNFISGYNQSGFDGMSICLKCCSEIDKAIVPL